MEEVESESMGSGNTAPPSAAGLAQFWRRSCTQLLYAVLLQRALPQDVLSVCWLPGEEALPGSAPAMTRARLLLGTRGEDVASGSGGNWLWLLGATLPTTGAAPQQQKEAAYPTIPPSLDILQVGMAPAQSQMGRPATWRRVEGPDPAPAHSRAATLLD
jgi:hypothetical protein